MAKAQADGLEQDGAAAVEFALVAPILIFLIFGIIAFGYMLSFRQSLSQSTAEAARAAAIAPSSFTASQKTTAAIMSLNKSLADYNVTCTAATTASSNLVYTASGLLTSGSTPNAGTCSVAVAPCMVNGMTNTTGASCATVTVAFAYRNNARLYIPFVNSALPQTLNYVSSAQVS